MKTRALLSFCLFSAACIHVERQERVERGPLLRTFHRPEVVEGGVRAKATVEFPNLSIELEGWDTCKDVTVEEYAEDHTVETSSPAAGPSFSAGVTNLMLSGILFATSFFVSSAPNTGVIDASGRYGPSMQQLVRGWGLVTLGIGVPALVVGIAASLQTGEESKQVKVESVAEQKESRCHERSLSGPVELVAWNGAVVAKAAAKDGPATFDAKAFVGEPDAVQFFGRKVELDEAGLKLLDGYAACLALDHVARKPVGEWNDEELAVRVDQTQRCRVAAKGDIKTETEALEDELHRRRNLTTGPAGPLEVPPETWEEAVAKAHAGATLEAGAKALERLIDAKALEGLGFVVKGLVVGSGSGSLVTLQLGAQEVVLVVPAEHRWSAELKEGARVEAVGVAAGFVAREGQPVFRALWVRNGF